MYVLSNWTFTPNIGGYDQVIVPGVFAIEQFAEIENATKNTTLYTSTDSQHLGSITVSDDGSQTTILVWPSDPDSAPGDQIRVIMYDPTPTGSGPTSNVAVTNWPASQNINGTVSVSNFPATQTVTGTVGISGEVEVKNDAGNPLAVSGTVNVGNFPPSQPITGTVTANQGTSPWTVSGTVTANQGTTPWDVSVGNFPVIQPISGTVDIGNEVEVKNDSGNPLAVSGTVTANQGTSPWVVTGTTTSTVSSFPATSTDAFGRLRVSNPFTIFDSSHRYADNGQWATATATGGTTTFNAAQGLMDLNVTAAAGSQVVRQTTKVFPYQPGKSLLVMSTFVMSPAKAGLSQRVGYYGDANGYYIELTDNTLAFVERSAVSGAITETTVIQNNWNVDPMDGSGPSGITLDISKAQILWLDMEWLGVGTVRMGFVIDGIFYVCHEWEHANLIASTYITTATLPITYEIINDSATVSASTLKQICSTVISEGGYTLSGTQQSIGTSILTPKTLVAAGTYYPVAAIRLKTSRLDAVAILSALSLMGNGNNETFAWRLVNNATVAGGAWNSVGSDSSVEYNLDGTSVSGGNILGSGYFNSSNQGSPTITLDKEYLFGLQLSRDPFTATANSMVLEVASANNNTTVYASLDWEEVSR
jgi:hypothetical protein